MVSEGLVLNMERLKVTTAVVLGFVTLVLYLDFAVLQSLPHTMIPWGPVRRDCSENSKTFLHIYGGEVPFLFSSYVSYKRVRYFNSEAFHVRCTDFHP